MAHHHRHHHHNHDGKGASPDRNAEVRRTQRRRLRAVFALTLGFMFVELVGGWMAGSLALLADAGHMLSDSSAIFLSLLAFRVAERPPDLRRTYGYGRTEILAALLNGATLLALAGWITWEALERIRVPSPVDGGLLFAVAGIGFLVNLVAARLLHGHSHTNLNVRGAYLHVLGDLLGSAGALVAGGVILFTGWTYVDPLVSVLIAGLVLVGAWRLMRDAADVLMEACPRHIDLGRLTEALNGIPGLSRVHDLHVWTVTGGFVAMSGHGSVDAPSEIVRVLDAIRDEAGRWDIEHVTFQLEPPRLYQIAVGDRVPGA